MRKVFITFILLIVICFSSVYSQDDIKGIFDKANKFYMDEKYREAAGEYIKIVEMGYGNGAVYFNLGNAYYKLGNIGKAILYYEKARIIIPGDEDLQTNIKLANLQIADKIIQVPELFYIRYFNKIINLISSDNWYKTFLILFILLCIIISARIIIKVDKLEGLLNKLIYIAAIFTLLLLFISVYSSYELNRHDWGVIMSEKADAYSSPTDDSTGLFSIHEGTKVRIKRIQGRWIEIVLVDGKLGWIEKTKVEII